MIQDSMQFAAVESGLRFTRHMIKAFLCGRLSRKHSMFLLVLEKHISLQVGQRTHLRSFCFTGAFSALQCGIRISRR